MDIDYLNKVILEVILEGINEYGVLVEEDLANLIEEGTKRSLKELALNFPKIYNDSDWRNLKVENVKVYGEDTTELKVVAQVKSSNNRKAYNNVIVLRRKELDEPWSVDMMAEVRCSCPAYQYYNAYSNWINKNFYGKPNRWTKVKPKKINTKLIPGVCKHLMATTKYLVDKKIVEK